MKVRLQESKAETKMSMDKQYWAGQAAAYFTQTQQNMSQEAVVNNYLDRDFHNYTCTLDELMEKRLNTKIRAEAGESQQAGRQTGEEWLRGDQEDDEADGGLVGAAASAASAAAPCASPATKTSSAAKVPASRGHAESLTPPRPHAFANLGGNQAGSGIGFVRAPSFSGSQAGKGTATPPGSSTHGSDLMDDRVSDAHMEEGQWLYIHHMNTV